MTTITKKKITPSIEDVNFATNLLTTHSNNKSKTIRDLYSQGWEKSRIARSLGILYQFVRNVLNQPLKKTS